MASKNDELTDLLRIEGVMLKGYGNVPKVTVEDIALPCSATAIINYYCSLTGPGNRVFPSRDRILEDLRISLKAYYKGRDILVAEGYISITQEKTANGKFSRNIYTIHTHPAKYSHPPTDNPTIAKMYYEIMEFGIYSLGYGMVPYAVMSDPRMKYQPKAVYGYISAHKDRNGYADLSPTIMAYHLGIRDPHTLGDHINKLIELNYITVERLKENGKYSEKNRYRLIERPDKANVQNKIRSQNTLVPKPMLVLPNMEKEPIDAPNVKKDNTATPNVKKDNTATPNVKKDNTATPNVKKDNTAMPNVKKDNTATPNVKKDNTAAPNVKKENAEKENAEKENAEKDNTINTSSTITSFTNTSSNITSVLMDRLISRVRKLINYEIMCFAYAGTEIELMALDTLVLAVAETLASPLPRINIAGQPYMSDYVRNVLLTINNTAACNVLERFLVRVDKISPENHKSYLLTSIYRELQNSHADDGCEAHYSVP